VTVSLEAISARDISASARCYQNDTLNGVDHSSVRFYSLGIYEVLHHQINTHMYVRDDVWRAQQHISVGVM